MALLHSFWYEEARKDFESIAQQDFRCDIAYWGIAMTYWSQVAGDWPSNDDVKVAWQALAKARTPASSRERAYIKAIADFYGASGQPDFRTQAQGYSAAMMRIHEQYPDDQEAAAFYGLSILARSLRTNRNWQSGNRRPPFSRNCLRRIPTIREPRTT